MIVIGKSLASEKFPKSGARFGSEIRGLERAIVLPLWGEGSREGGELRKAFSRKSRGRSKVINLFILFMIHFPGNFYLID